MRNPNHTRRLPKGIARVFESMTDKQVIQLTFDVGPAGPSVESQQNYAERVTRWLLEHGYVSLQTGADT